MTPLMWIAWWLLWCSSLFAAFVIMAQRKRVRQLELVIEYLQRRVGDDADWAD